MNKITFALKVEKDLKKALQDNESEQAKDKEDDHPDEDEDGAMKEQDESKS